MRFSIIFCVFMVLCLMGLSIRSDFAGVTSFVRALGLKGFYYNRILDCLQGSGIDLKVLTDLWVRLVFKLFREPLRVNGRLVILADGFKAAKEGRKMPGVKSLHQDSQNNSKSEYIMGHSCQAVSLVVAAGESFFAVPLVSRIHEGVVTSNRDQKTLLDKLILLVRSLKIPEPFYLVADAYYATAKVIKGLPLIQKCRACTWHLFLPFLDEVHDAHQAKVGRSVSPSQA